MTASTWRAAPYTRPPEHSASRRPRLAVVVSGWPRVSETFAVNELAALRDAGMLAAVIATKPGDAGIVQPDVAALDDLVTVLPDLDLAAATEAALAALADAGPIDAVHGYFAHTPTALAEGIARRLGVPFGFSVHALDVRKVEPDELRRRAAAAAIVVTCNADVAATLGRLGIDHRLVPHGVDTSRFHPAPARPDEGRATTIVAVGRLVEKKGFRYLVDAMAEIDPSVRAVIVGEGPERADLESRIAAHALEDRVELLGRLTHDRLPDVLRAADIAVVPSIVDRAGDRDGLPNVVLEAMATGLPVVASDVAAIAVAIDGPDVGVLVPPADGAAIARTIAALVSAPTELRRLGRGARKAAVTHFDLDRCARRFCDLLEASHA